MEKIIFDITMEELSIYDKSGIKRKDEIISIVNDIYEFILEIQDDK